MISSYRKVIIEAKLGASLLNKAAITASALLLL